MRSKFIKKLLYVFLAIAFWTLVWEAASFLIGNNLKLFLPSPFVVFKALLRLSQTAAFWQAVLYSLLRIFAGLVAGVISGIVFGLATGKIKIFDILFSPAMRVIRAVPVVSFIILAFLFVKVDWLPVFISMLMVMPVVWQTVHDKLSNFDNNTKEMARIFKIKGTKKLLFVVIPTISDEVISAVINAIGLAWKSGIASEVLCSPAVSLGKSIITAKNQINFDDVYALTLAVVILSMIFEYLVKYLYKKQIGRKKYD